MVYIISFQLPNAVAALQRSVHGVLLGKVIRPDWITHGVPKTAKLTSFKLKLPGGKQLIYMSAWVEILKFAC